MSEQGDQPQEPTLTGADIWPEDVGRLQELLGKATKGLLPAETAGRWLRAVLEMTSGGDPRRHLARDFPVELRPGSHYVTQGGVLLGPVEFASICEHHLFPFVGRAWVYYWPRTEPVPDGHPTDDFVPRVLGLSKVARYFVELARRPQMQERLTAQATADFAEVTACVYVLVDAWHTCCSARGAEQPSLHTVTYSFAGPIDPAEARLVIDRERRLRKGEGP